MTFPHYLYNKNQFIKYGIILLNQTWPCEATRLMGLRLQNMRDRKRDKGVRVCPEVKMSEVEFLEPLDENGERADEIAVHLDENGKEIREPEEKSQSARLAKTPHDDEEPSDPNIALQHDDDNMKCAADKILRKMTNQV